MFSLHPPACAFTPPVSLSLPPSYWVDGFRTNSPTETLSLDTPLSEALSPSPTQPPTPWTANREEKPQEEDKEDEGDRTVSVPCYEIHATGLRRCSEPLTFNLPPPGAEPPDPALSPLMGSSEQRFLSRYACSHPSNPRLHLRCPFSLTLIDVVSSCKLHLIL